MQYTNRQDPALQNNPYYKELSWDYSNTGGGQLQSMMPPDNNNSPCDNPNPPAWCTGATVPIGFMDVMLVVSLIFGIILVSTKGFLYEGRR